MIKEFFNRFFVLIVVLVVLALVYFWRKFGIGELFNNSSSAQPPDSQNDSEIISFYAKGHSIVKAERGKIGDMSFYIFMTIPNTVSNAGSALINVLDLPFSTNSHVIGLSKEHDVDRIEFGNFVKANNMEKVVLEGDFEDYFDLYAPKDQQVSVRETLDPAAMEYVVDYCQTHFWEINRAELYFVSSSEDKKSDDIFKEAQDFVNHIKPALLPGDPGAAVVHHELPYGEYDGPPLACPICNKPMTTNNLWHTCPDGHGILITGRELSEIRDHQVTIPSDAADKVKHDLLKCPNCHNQMEEVNYQGSGVMIDSCVNCPYRWLDADEISEIASGKEYAQNTDSDPSS